MPPEGPTPFRAWLAVGAWMAVTLILSTFPVEDLQPNVANADKFGHAAVYAVLGFLCGVAWQRHGSSHSAVVERAMALVLLFGALMEYLQSLVGRDPSMGDWIADGIGGLIGVLFWKAWRIAMDRRVEQPG
ncbi:MAG TPA: VanZ family protein [Gemmatimonadota bacterium]|nr:VanZ family protein [Gemmatimonadota bacterium]